MEPVLDVLHKMRELFSDPNRWTTGILAVDANDRPVHHESPAACKFCLIGSIIHFAGYDTPLCSEVRWHLAKIIAAKNPGADCCRISVPHFNDTASYKDILGVIDEAIAQKEAALARR